MAELSVAQAKAMHKKRHKLKYAKWGLIFLIPFFLVYFVFQLYPLLSTFKYSFFDTFKSTTFVKDVDNGFIGLQNYIELFKEGDILKFFANTGILWVLGFVPQIILSLLFASWFTDLRLKLKGTGFFKIIFYLPNILMAASMAGLFASLFSSHGAVNTIMAHMTGNTEYFSDISQTVFNFFNSIWGTRGLIAFVNFLMWTGNTTILLVAGIMGIDPALYEAASIDGANSRQLFHKITLPTLKPIMVYVMITSLIGGLQMFDIPQLLTMGGFNNAGGTEQGSMTVVMYLNQCIDNYGRAGAISVLLFIVAAILSVIVFRSMSEKEPKPKKSKVKKGVA